MLAAFAFFMVAWYRMGKREASDPLVKELGASAADESHASLRVAWVLFFVGLVLLLLGGKMTEIGAVKVADWFGLSDALIGLTIVAVATSLPELTTCVIAVRKGHDDLAVGNIVGSNVFNLLLVLGLTATITPVTVPERWWWCDLLAMNVFTVLLLVMATTHRRKLVRLEGGSLLLLYAVYMAFSVWRELGGSETAAP